MKLNEMVDVMVCVNLPHRSDRCRTAWQQFREQGWEVERQPGVEAAKVKDTRGFLAPERYACSLAKRLALRRGKLAGAKATLLLEDDVVLASDLERD